MRWLLMGRTMCFSEGHWRACRCGMMDCCKGIGKEHWTMKWRDELGRNIGQWYDDGMASGIGGCCFCAVVQQSSVARSR